MVICFKTNQMNNQIKLQLLKNQYNIAQIYIKLGQINAPGNLQQYLTIIMNENASCISKRSNENVRCLKKRKIFNSWTFLYEVLYRIQIWTKKYIKIILIYKLTKTSPMDRQQFNDKDQQKRKHSSQIISKLNSSQNTLRQVTRSQGLYQPTKLSQISSKLNLQDFSYWKKQKNYMNIHRNPKCQIPPQFMKLNDFQESSYKQTLLTCYANQYIKIHILMNNLYLRRCKNLIDNGSFSYEIFCNNFSKRQGSLLIKPTKAKSPFCQICSKFYDQSTQGLQFINRYLRDIEKNKNITLSNKKIINMYVQEQSTYLTLQIKNAPSCRSIKLAFKLKSNQLIQQLRLSYIDDPFEYQPQQHVEPESNQRNLNQNQPLANQYQYEAPDLQRNANRDNIQSHILRLQVGSDSDRTFAENQSQNSFDRSTQ